MSTRAFSPWFYLVVGPSVSNSVHQRISKVLREAFFFLLFGHHLTTRITRQFTSHQVDDIGGKKSQFFPSWNKKRDPSK